MKWNLRNHAKDKQNFIMLVVKYGYPSVWTRGPRVEDHIAMNIRILRNAYLQQNQNEVKMVDCAKKKIAKE